MFFIGEPVSTSPEHALGPLPAGSAVPAQLEAGECGVSEDESSPAPTLYPYLIHTCLFRQIQLFGVMNDR
jgi:hypothetical protein